MKLNTVLDAVEIVDGTMSDRWTVRFKIKRHVHSLLTTTIRTVNKLGNGDPISLKSLVIDGAMNMERQFLGSVPFYRHSVVVPGLSIYPECLDLDSETVFECTLEEGFNIYMPMASIREFYGPGVKQACDINRWEDRSFDIPLGDTVEFINCMLLGLCLTQLPWDPDDVLTVKRHGSFLPMGDYCFLVADIRLGNGTAVVRDVKLQTIVDKVYSVYCLSVHGDKIHGVRGAKALYVGKDLGGKMGQLCTELIHRKHTKVKELVR